MSLTMNRRQFVSAAAAGAALAGLGATAALADEAPVAGSYDVIVLGAGGAGMCAANIPEGEEWLAVVKFAEKVVEKLRAQA